MELWKSWIDSGVRNIVWKLSWALYDGITVTFAYTDIDMILYCNINFY